MRLNQGFSSVNSTLHASGIALSRSRAFLFLFTNGREIRFPWLSDVQCFINGRQQHIPEIVTPSAEVVVDFAQLSVDSDITAIGKII